MQLDRSLLNQRVDAHRARLRCVEPCDRQAVEASVRRCHRAVGLSSPRSIVWVDSPYDDMATNVGFYGLPPGADRGSTFEYAGDMVRIVDTPIKSAEQLALSQSDVFDSISRALNGRTTSRVGSVGIYFYTPTPRSEYNDMIAVFECLDAMGFCIPMLSHLFEWFKHGIVYHFGRSRCVLIERPMDIALDGQNRLHNLTGPAMEYRDGFCEWAVHGVPVPDYVVLEPETITAEDIDSEPNMEVRRIKLQQMGIERYLSEGHAKETIRDDFGVLFSKPDRNDGVALFAKVLNSTPEPDGTFKTYFLRVPPTIKTPKEAVAWSFGVRPEDYHLVAQT